MGREEEGGHGRGFDEIFLGEEGRIWTIGSGVKEGRNGQASF